MSAYSIDEVDGVAHAERLRALNAMQPDRFPPLEERHLRDGYWWLAHIDETVAGFAGLVAMHPFPNVGYLKRAYVLPRHRGRGLQAQFLEIREQKARALGWMMLVTECAGDNDASRRNLERAGYVHCDPEQRWGAPGSIYFVKQLT